MNEKVDIAEHLKDCPDGMELDCTMFEKPVKYVGLTKSGTYDKSHQESPFLYGWD